MNDADGADGADGTRGAEDESVNLFCVEGKLQVRRPVDQGMFRILEAITPRFAWTWWERQGIDARL